MTQTQVAAHHNVIVRVGIPQTSGALVKASYAAGLPVLFSSNAFARTDQNKTFKRFNLTAAKRLPADMDCALDSAGFVAMALYGDYRWSPEQYMELVRARDWAWWSPLDYCVEPEVASDRVTKEIRISATVAGYDKCVRLAQDWEVKPPICILQGYEAQDYVRCARAIGLERLPSLIGLGSVCRRHLGGPAGVATIFDALDNVLPNHCKIHAFGVKSGAIQQLGRHPRLFSVDSMSYDAAARASMRTGRTQDLRISHMMSWHQRQCEIVPDMQQLQMLDLLEADNAQPIGRDDLAKKVVESALAEWYASDLLDEHGYRETAHLAAQQASEILWRLRLGNQRDIIESTDSAEMAAAQALIDAGIIDPALEAA